MEEKTNPCMGGLLGIVTLHTKIRMLRQMGLRLVSKRLREVRLSLGLSQEALGAQGFVSTPGWVKIENGTRQPSDGLLESLADWMVKDGYLELRKRSLFLDELLSLKYMEHLSPFVRRLAREYHAACAPPHLLKAAEDPAYPAKPRKKPTVPSRARPR